MNTTFITPKANEALKAIAEGNREQVTRQMIDRLYGRKMIDFDHDRGGWFLTDYGWMMLNYQK